MSMSGKRKIVFITRDERKLAEAREVLGEFAEISGLKIDLPEIQGADSRGIVEKKLLEGMKKTDAPEIIVEDSSLRLSALRNLPGPMVKWFVQAIGAGGIYNMSKWGNSYDAKAVSVLGYLRRLENPGGPNYKINLFEGETSGWIVPPKGENGLGWDPVFLPEGSIKTFAEMGAGDKARVSHRRKAFEEMKKFLEKETHRSRKK
jgi:inosine triphosphate pyrophosphatase